MQSSYYIIVLGFIIICFFHFHFLCLFILICLLMSPYHVSLSFQLIFIIYLLNQIFSFNPSFYFLILEEETMILISKI
jgi:hypothetical protein